MLLLLSLSVCPSSHRRLTYMTSTQKGGRCVKKHPKIADKQLTDFAYRGERESQKSQNYVQSLGIIEGLRLENCTPLQVPQFPSDPCQM